MALLWYQDPEHLAGLKAQVAFPALADAVDTFLLSAEFSLSASNDMASDWDIFQEWLDENAALLHLPLDEEWDNSSLQEYFYAAAERQIALRKTPLLSEEHQIQPFSAHA